MTDKIEKHVILFLIRLTFEIFLALIFVEIGHIPIHAFHCIPLLFNILEKEMSLKYSIFNLIMLSRYAKRVNNFVLLPYLFYCCFAY